MLIVCVYDVVLYVFSSLATISLRLRELVTFDYTFLYSCMYVYFLVCL